MPVIKVENLSKKYSISHLQQERYTALRDVISNSTKKIAGKILRPFTNSIHKPSNSTTREDFWALRDISFEIKQGDRVGIIGRNGAGKSTLLKILSRITEPTSGRIEITGRVASLLEVGTGFHPELTGRENIYLNGAVLGMGKVEIKRKFDEIVDFAEVEKFLDTPVKRYSSGMYVRLAFAVAAHLEPEILIVDEVLAVGDAEFQKKCLGKMKDAAKGGKTVLFVSHNMSAIKALCSRGICLHSGSLTFDGGVSDCIHHYLGNSRNTMDVFVFEKPQKGFLLNAKWLSGGNWILEQNTPLRISFDVLPERKLNANLEVVIRDQLGTPLALLSPGHFAGQLISFPVDKKTTIILETEPLALASGIYSVDVSLCEPNKECFGSSCGEITFEVTVCDPYGRGFSYKSADNVGFWFLNHKTYVDNGCT